MRKKVGVILSVVAVLAVLAGGFIIVSNPFKVTDPSDPRFDPDSFCASLGITSINLGYSDTSSAIEGNDIRYTSTFTKSGNTRTIVDAWFSYDNSNTVYAQDYTLDLRTLFLPTVRGGACPRAGGEQPAANDNQKREATTLLSRAS